MSEQKKRSQHIISFSFLVLATIYSALYLELFYESSHTTSSLLDLVNSSFSSGYGSVVRLIAFALLCFLAFSGILKLIQKHELSEKIFRFRYLIGLIIFLILFAFQISGSSIAQWASVFGYEGDTGVLFGKSRSIRSDEWLVFTPFGFSQAFTGYSGTSDIIRGTATDVTMVYAQPAWSIATLFRPFLWGYLVFGSAFGLSFFWLARLFALFFVSFECARIYTKENRVMSLAVAILVTFAPIVQWWFAVNGTAELFIFGQLLVICLWNCLKNKHFTVLSAVLIPWLSGCFLFILYPAWQVPIFYVFAGMGIGLFVLHKRDKNTQVPQKQNANLNSASLPTKGINKKALIGFFISVIIVVIAVAISLLSSWDTIQAVSGTTYPGERSETGGGLATCLFNYGLSTYSAFFSGDITSNSCEQAAFYSLFPCGIILTFLVLIKKKDPLLITLLIVDVLFFIYGLFGLPEIICKITLLSNVQTGRIVIAIGYIDIVILARSIILAKEAQLSAKPFIIAILTSCAIGIVFCVQAPTVNLNGILGVAKASFLVLAFLLAFISLNVFIKNKTQNLGLFLVFAITVVGISGFCVNPVQKGSDFLNDIPEIQKIQEINNQESGLWAGDKAKEGQACILTGAASINSVNTYPDNTRWQTIDPTGQFKNIYNRYAHIYINIKSEGGAEFELNTPDSFTVTLTLSDLRKLGVNYLFTSKDYSVYDESDSEMSLIAQVGNYRYYKV